METVLTPGRRSLPPVPRPAAATVPEAIPLAGSVPASTAVGDLDAIAQGFVNRVRSAAADFAAAAGAASAVVCEAVPPARHRRSRCRLVLQYADGSERDLTFLGEAGTPTRSRLSFDRHIQGWLRAGQLREPAWLAADADAGDGLAIDIPAWLATGVPTSR
ncbi:MAG: hypothetical protein QOJ68_1723 [Blastococcus sp.]|jgi:hypothetical protein|nr:hypothetical protein [Blastococcus sp.]